MVDLNVVRPGPENHPPYGGFASVAARLKVDLQHFVTVLAALLDIVATSTAAPSGGDRKQEAWLV